VASLPPLVIVRATAGCVVTNPYLPQIPAHGTTLRKAFQVSRRPSGHRLRLCGRLCLCARSCGMACCTRGPARPPGGTGCSGHPFLAGHRPGCDDRLSPTSTTNRVVADAPSCVLAGKGCPVSGVPRSVAHGIKRTRHHSGPYSMTPLPAWKDAPASAFVVSKIAQRCGANTRLPSRLMRAPPRTFQRSVENCGCGPLAPPLPVLLAANASAILRCCIPGRCFIHRSA